MTEEQIRQLLSQLWDKAEVKKIPEGEQKTPDYELIFFNREKVYIEFKNKIDPVESYIKNSTLPSGEVESFSSGIHKNNSLDKRIRTASKQLEGYQGFRFVLLMTEIPEQEIMHLFYGARIVVWTSDRMSQAPSCYYARNSAYFTKYSNIDGVILLNQINKRLMMGLYLNTRSSNDLSNILESQFCRPYKDRLFYPKETEDIIIPPNTSNPEQWVTENHEECRLIDLERHTTYSFL